MPNRFLTQALLATAFGLTSQGMALAKEQTACEALSKIIPKTLSKARELSPLLKEVVAPDLDYCHEDFSKCDLRTLVFDGFSLRFLHVKKSHRVSIHVAEFSSFTKMKEICGKECLSEAAFNANTRKHVIDCQSTM